MLDVHGGTREADVLGAFAEAEARVAAAGSGADARAYVFLDEMNAAPHVGLITEAICQRTLNGAAISPNVVVLAALNPYRRRPQHQLEQAPGLVFRGGGAAGADGGAPDPMAALVYRVHPVPATLMDFIFDFGALSRAKEALYVRSMVDGELGPRCRRAAECALFATLIVEAQAYVREVEGDASAVSLRDVRRALDLLAWFEEHAVPKSKRPRPIAVALALAHVYLYRLGSGTLRAGLWKELRTALLERGITASSLPSVTEAEVRQIPGFYVGEGNLNITGRRLLALKQTLLP